MNKLKQKFTFSGQIESRLYRKFSDIWDSKLNVLPEGIGGQFLSIRIGMAI